jgi:hypothetical protein
LNLRPPGWEPPTVFSSSARPSLLNRSLGERHDRRAVAAAGGDRQRYPDRRLAPVRIDLDRVGDAQLGRIGAARFEAQLGSASGRSKNRAAEGRRCASAMKLRVSRGCR